MKNNIIHRCLLIGVAITALLQLYACSGGYWYRHFEKVSGYIWEKQHIVVFEIPVKEPMPLLKTTLALRYGDGYEHNDLNVRALLESPSGKTTTLEAQFAIKDLKGEYVGKGMGELWDTQVELPEITELPEVGTYRLSLQHAMPEPEVFFVVDLGVLIKDISKK